MIRVKEALRIVTKSAKPLGKEKVDILSSLGKVLAENIYSDIDIPPFDRSAMDGFAVNSNDKSEIFEVIEDIPAGKVPSKRVMEGQCARIMTGAMLPKGADKVIMVEDTKPAGKNKIKVTYQDSKRNVSPKGEDIKKGKIVLKKNAVIRPQEIAMLATCGKTKLKVFCPPKVAVISTGSELVEPFSKPAKGQIRNSNGYMVLQQLKELGVNGKYLGIAKDNFNTTKKLIERGLRGSDILILSGGVSVGDYDFVRDVLSKCGVKIIFEKVAVRPGRPTVFGKKGNKLIFALPGNPVSVLIIFKILVKPVIYKILGREIKSDIFRMKILNDFKRRSSNVEQYYPVKLTEQGVVPLNFHGSAHMHSLTFADAVMCIKRGIKYIKKGTIVDVRQI